jgi:hypothetical protein
LSAPSTSIAAKLIGALSTLVVFAPVTQAQRVETTVDAGAMALRYADTLSTGAIALTPHFVADFGSSLADASATFSGFASGGRSGQGDLSLTRFSPASHGLFGELSAFAGGSAHSDGTRTGEVLGSGRVHRSFARGDVFLGAGIGRTYDGLTWRTSLQGEVGSAFEAGPTNAILSVTPTTVNDTIRYADFQGVLSWKRDKLEVGGQGGFRVGRPLVTLGSDQKVWLSANAVYALTQRFAVVTSGGTYPVNPTEGFPGGRFVSLSMRWLPGRHAMLESESTVKPASGAAVVSSDQPSATGLIVSRRSADSVVFRVTTANASQVEIAGDFTGWKPRPMVPAAPGVWTLTLPMLPGTYQMNVRLNGGEWVAPPSMLTMLDEFGGRVGLLVIER